MPIVTFRASIPTPTPAITPFTLDLISQARVINELILWQSTGTFDVTKAGFRLLDRGSSKVFIPDVGSQDISAMANPGESGWAPIPGPPAIRITLGQQIIEGPPYRVTLAFFNNTGATMSVGGFLIVREPTIEIDWSSIYELLTRGNPPREFAEGTQQGLKPERAGKDETKESQRITQVTVKHS